MSTVTFHCAHCAGEPDDPAQIQNLRVALVGTPNCGKTALFNALTGSRQKVANYAGVTVERKEGVVCTPVLAQFNLVDLPGTMSLNAHSPDEVITRDVILGLRTDEKQIDAILCVADANNLRPSLRLLMELKTTGLPITLVLNMVDIARAHGNIIDTKKLTALVGVDVVECVAVRPRGTDALLNKLCEWLVLWRSARNTPRPSWQEPALGALRHWSNEAEQIVGESVIINRSPSLHTNKLDRIVLHPAAGLVILFAVLFLMFQALFAGAAPIQDLMDSAFSSLASLARDVLPDSLFRDFITDAVIAGVGSVLTFLPQVMLLFVFIILLEDCGYMARAAFLLDKLMGGVGLQGRAFIPLLSSFACAIPGILATRTIANPKDRLVTILTAPFMTCSARLPVYALIVAGLIPEKTLWGFVGLQGLVMFGLYALGIVGGLLVALTLKKTILKGPNEPLMLMLPNYQRPHLKFVAWEVWQRGWMFVKRAGGIIFLITVILWFLLNFPMVETGAHEITQSYAGKFGSLLAPLLAPIGFSWQMTLSLIPAMAAREVAIATLGTIYAVGHSVAVVSDDTASYLTEALRQTWTLPQALSYLVWFAFAPQCLSTLVVVKRETLKWRWPILLFVLMLAMAYLGSWATFALSSILLE